VTKMGSLRYMKNLLNKLGIKSAQKESVAEIIGRLDEILNGYDPVVDPSAFNAQIDTVTETAADLIKAIEELK
jgi:hypothetical protein